MCFPVNFVKFLRTPFLHNTSRQLLDKWSLMQKLTYSKIIILCFLSLFSWKKIMKSDHRYLFLRKKIVKNRKIFKTMAHSGSLKMIRHTLNILQHLLKHFLFVWPFLGPYALKSKVSDLPGYWPHYERSWRYLLKKRE